MRELRVLGLLALAQSISLSVATPVPFSSGEAAPSVSSRVLRRAMGESVPLSVKPTCDNAPNIIAGTYYGPHAQPASPGDRLVDSIVHRAEDDSSKWHHPPPPTIADPPSHPDPLNPRAAPFPASARWCAFATKTYVCITPFSPPSPSQPGLPALLHDTWANITEHIRVSQDGLIPSGVYDAALPGNGVDKALRFHAEKTQGAGLTWGVLGAALTAVGDWMNEGKGGWGAERGMRGMRGMGFGIWDGGVGVGVGWVG